MNTLENILIIAGISLDVFASMEIQGAMLQKVNKKTLLVVSAIVSLLQLMFFFGGYAAGYGIDRAGVWRNASWVGYILDTIIFALLGSRLIVKGIRREFVDETRSVITVKQYAKIIAVTTVYTLFASKEDADKFLERREKERFVKHEIDFATRNMTNEEFDTIYNIIKKYRK